MNSVLYITRNGMLEPLGQSQVLAYLRPLSTVYRVTLISFEKPEDWANRDAVARVQADCDAHGIRWLPQRFHYRPRIIAPAWSMVVFLALCLREVRLHGIRLIHARSYIPSAVALLVSRLTGTPYVFDMRALWPEELITAGRLRRGSVLHRLIAWAERKCIERAAAVVSLTQAAVVHLQALYPKAMDGRRVVVIPTCADLQRFAMAEASHRPVIRVGCCGTVVSGWFRLDWLAALYRQAARSWPDAEFEIVTRDPADTVRRFMLEAGMPEDRLRIYAATPSEMPAILREETVNVMLFTSGVGKLGSSPTRLGEVLGCGRTVIANRGVGDVAEIVEKYRVGVLMESDEPTEIDRVLQELLRLLADPGLAGRCRRAAEEVFSLEAGAAAYDRLYREILA